jgi:hypothetical protein
MKKQFAKLLHLGVGVHSFGNATTLLAKPNQMTLQLLPEGILATSIQFRKKALIPYANIRAIELEFDSTFGELEEPKEIKLNNVEVNLEGLPDDEIKDLSREDLIKKISKRKK